MALRRSDPKTAERQAAARRAYIEAFLDQPDRSSARTEAKVAGMAALGLSESQWYECVKRYREEGRDGLVRKQRVDKGRRRALTPQERDAFLGYATHPDRYHWTMAQKVSGYRKFLAETHGKKLHCSDMTLERVLRETHEGHGQTAREFREAWMRHLKVISPHANFVWQMDQRVADLFVVERLVDRATGEISERRFRPTLFHLVDVYSGVEMGGRYFEAYDTPTVEAAFLDAIYPDPVNRLPACGTPAVIYCDNGEQHKSRWFRGACEALGIDIDYSEKRRPITHGFVEQTNRMAQEFESGQPGFVGGDNDEENRPLIRRLEAEGEVPEVELLTIDQLNERWKRWVAELLLRPYRGGEPRMARWQRSILDHPDRRSVPEPARLAWQFMRDAYVSIRGGCFQFRTITYTGERLGGLNGERVRIRYLDGEVMRVYVELRGEMYCVATPQDAHLYGAITGFRDLERRNRELRQVRQTFRQSANIIRAAGALEALDPGEAAETADALERAAVELPKRQAAAILDQADRQTAPAHSAPKPAGKSDNVVIFPGRKPDPKPLATEKQRPAPAALDGYLTEVTTPEQKVAVDDYFG